MIIISHITRVSTRKPNAFRFANIFQSAQVHRQDQNYCTHCLVPINRNPLGQLHLTLDI